MQLTVAASGFFRNGRERRPELKFIDGEVASCSAKEEFAILLNRPRVANGGPDGI